MFLCTEQYEGHYNLIEKYIMGEIMKPTKGIFWLIDDELLAIPFEKGKYLNSVAKSGDTYVHKYLWREISYSTAPYNYYPRGRVEINKSGKEFVYMNSNIGICYVNKIIIAFGLKSYPRIIYDNSMHYKCYLDDGWKAD